MNFRKRKDTNRLMRYCRTLFLMGAAGVSAMALSEAAGEASEQADEEAVAPFDGEKAPDTAASPGPVSRTMESPVLDQSCFNARNLTVSSDSPGTYKVVGADRDIHGIPISVPLFITDVTTTVTNPGGLIIDGVRGLMVKLEQVNLVGNGSGGIDLRNNAEITLFLDGTNSLTGGSSGGYSYAGLHVSNSSGGTGDMAGASAAVIKNGPAPGAGSLTATGGDVGGANLGSAGIGGGGIPAIGGTPSHCFAGYIVIESGNITAIGGSGAAGIGGGNGDYLSNTNAEYVDTGGSITIKGGRVEAIANNGAAGIGGGYGGCAGNVIITGGVVKATGRTAGIGSGYAAAGGMISILGGNVKAYGTNSKGDVTGIGSYRSQFDPSIVTLYQPTKLNIGKSAVLRAYCKAGSGGYAITVDDNACGGDALVQNNYFSPEGRPNPGSDMTIVTPGWPNSDITLPAGYCAFAYTAPNAAMRHRTNDGRIIISLDPACEGAYLIPSRGSDLYPGGTEPTEIKLSSDIPMDSRDFTRRVSKAQNMLDLPAASRVTAFASAAALTSSGELHDPMRGEVIVGATTLIRVDIAGYAPPSIGPGTYPVIFLGKRKEKVGDDFVRVDGTAVVRMTVLRDGYDGGSGASLRRGGSAGTGIEAKSFRIPLSRYAALTADGELKRLAGVSVWYWDDNEIHGYYPLGDVGVDTNGLKPESGSYKISFKTQEDDGAASASVWATVYDDSRGGGVVSPPVDLEDPASKGTAISAHSFSVKSAQTAEMNLYKMAGAAAWRWKQDGSASTPVSPSYINVSPASLPAAPGVYPVTFRISPLDGCPPAHIKVWAVVYDGIEEGDAEIDFTDPTDENSVGQAIYACAFTKTEDEAAELLTEFSPSEAIVREAKVKAWTWSQSDTAPARSVGVKVLNDGIYRSEAGDYDIIYAVDVPGGKRIMKQARVMGIPPIVRIMRGSAFTVTQSDAVAMLSSKAYVEKLVAAAGVTISPDGAVTGASITGHRGGGINVGTYMVTFSARYAEDIVVPMTIISDGKDGGGSAAEPGNPGRGSGIEARSFRIPLSQYDMHASGDAGLMAMSHVFAWEWERGNSQSGEYLLSNVSVDRSRLLKTEGAYKLTFSTREADGGAAISIWATVYDDSEGGGAAIAPTDAEHEESKGAAVAAHSFKLAASRVAGANIKGLAGVSSWIWQQKDSSSIAINSFYVSASPTVLPTEPGVYPLIFKAEPGNGYPTASIKVWVVIYDGKEGSYVEVDYPDPNDPSSTGQAIFAHDFEKTKGGAAAMLEAIPVSSAFISAAGARAYTWIQSDESVNPSAGVKVTNDGAFTTEPGVYGPIGFSVNIPGGRTISVNGSVSAKTVIAHNFTVTMSRAASLLPEANHLAELTGRAGAHISPAGIVGSAVIGDIPAGGITTGVFPVTFEAEGTDNVTVYMTVINDKKDSGGVGFDPVNPTRGAGIEACNYRIPISKYDSYVSDEQTLKALAEVEAWRREDGKPNAGAYPLADISVEKRDLIRAEGTYKTSFATKDGDGGANVTAWATVYDDSRGGGVIVTPTDPDDIFSKGTAMAAHSFRIRTGAVGSANLKYLTGASAWIWQQKDSSSTAINDSYITVSPSALPAAPGIYALTLKAEPGNDYPSAGIKVWAAVYDGADGGYVEVDYPNPMDPNSEGQAISVHNFTKTKGEAAAMLSAKSPENAYIEAADAKAYTWKQSDNIVEPTGNIKVIGDGGFKAETGTYTPISFSVGIPGGKAIGVTGVVSARTVIAGDFTVTKLQANSFLPPASHLTEIAAKAGAYVSPEGAVNGVSIGNGNDPIEPGVYPVTFSAEGTDDLTVRMTVIHDGRDGGVSALAPAGEGIGAGIEARNYRIPLSNFDAYAGDVKAMIGLADVYAWRWDNDNINIGDYPIAGISVDTMRLAKAEGTYKTTFMTKEEDGGAAISVWATVYNDGQGGGTAIAPTDPKDPLSKGAAVSAHSFKIRTSALEGADLRALTGASAWIWQEQDVSSIAINSSYISVSPSVLPATPGIYPLILRADPGNGYPTAAIKVWAVVYDGKEGSYVEIDFPDPMDPGSSGQAIYAHNFIRTTAQAENMNRLTDLISAANALAWTWNQSDIKVSSPVNVKVDSDGGIKAKEGEYPIRYIVNMPGGKSITIRGTIIGGHTAESME